MRLLVAAVATAFLALTTLVAAENFDTPEALLEAFYEPYFGGAFGADESVFRSEALNAMYAADLENTPEGEMGALGFDPYIDGQDYDIADFAIGAPDIAGDTALVEVSFTNFGEPRLITYDLVFENGGWRIHDLEGVNPEFSYRLSEMFEDAKEFWQD
ncbi:DUF3828 domain-containing protein [Devosia sp. CAU 1758]